MIYLIVQINNEQPSTIVFENLQKMNDYKREKLGDKTLLAIYTNTYYVHLEVKSDGSK